MDKYMAVDSGKYATKVAVYDKESNKTAKFKFRTKIGTGDFEDDAIEANTFIAEYNGNVYKIGNGASQEAELETTKKTEIHMICTLAAIAMSVSPNGCDNVHVAIGIPVDEYMVVQKRQEYKKYILPEGEIKFKLKTKSDKEPEERRFNIVSRTVYPESGGALYIDTIKYADNTAAVIDLGNLNINCTYWKNFELDGKYSLTSELGGNILIAGLAQELTAKFSRCDENYVAKVLRQPKEKRKLVPMKPDKEIEEKSAKVISEYLLNHVKEIRRKCDAKRWPLDYMQLVFIGGTSMLLKDEIKQVFGESVSIPDEPEYTNVVGFLKRLCATQLNILIPTASEAKDKMNGTVELPKDTKESKKAKESA